MPASIQTLAAFAAGPLRRVAAQISVSVTGGVCVAFLTHAYIIQSDRVSHGITEVPYAAAEVIAPRADRLPKSQEPVPVAALDFGEVSGVSGVSVSAGETEFAKRPAVVPRDDFGPATPGVAPEFPGAPMVQNEEPFVPPMAKTEEAPPPPIAQADEPGEPMVLIGAVPPRDLATDDEFDTGLSARPRARAVPILSVPLNVVAATADHIERTVVTLGNVVASIGRPARRY